MKRWKKVLSCVLALVMVVCLLPTVALAADDASVVMVARTDVTAGGYWVVTNEESEEHSSLMQCGANDAWNVSYEPGSATLTLRDAELYSDCTPQSGWPGNAENHLLHVVMNGDMNLVLLGENTCSINPVITGSRQQFEGILIDCGYSKETFEYYALTVSGGGSLAVSTAADLTDLYSLCCMDVVANVFLTGDASLSINIPDAPNAYVTGIFCGGDLTIDNGSLTVNVGDAKWITGIDADVETIEIRKGGLTVITGDTSDNRSTVLFTGAIVMSGGTLTAIGGNNSCGIVLDGDGIHDESITVTGGTLTAIGQMEALLSTGKNNIALGEDISVMVNTEASADGAAPWDGETLLGSYYDDDGKVQSPYKYIQITDGKQDESSTNPALGLLGGLLPTLGAQIMSPFVDVTPVDYYYDAVNWAVDKGITTGTGRLSFSPDEPCTRAQAVTFLWRAAGSPAPKSTATAFVDVDSTAYYAKAVAWAVENGITVGTSATTFSPADTCTRAQIVTFLYRAFGKSVNTTSSFTDVAADAYYAPAVAWAAANSITGGTGGGKFSPAAICTRAQIVTFLYRCCG